MRIDKFTWAVRLFKSRAMASKACTGDKVKVDGQFAKPGKIVSPGQEVAVKVNPIWRSYKILDLPKSRIGAKLLVQYILETTSETDLKQLEQTELINRQNNLLGIKGRPTKKDRRNIDQLRDRST